MNLTYKKKLKIAKAILEKYPSEFEQSEHESIVLIERRFVSGLGIHSFFNHGLWDKIENLWVHEKGMLVC